MTDEILTVARCLLGQTLTEDQETLLATLCENAAEHWQSRLREGLTPQDCRGSFVTACAWTALSRLVPALEAGTDTPRTFSAGDLSVSMGNAGGGRTQAALRLGREAEILLSDYIRDQGFFFREVAG